MRGAHTHFGSGTGLVATFLAVVLAGTLWRLSWLHVAARATSPFWRAVASAALFQY
jgi:hypothetical protein